MGMAVEMLHSHLHLHLHRLHKGFHRLHFFDYWQAGFDYLSLPEMTLIGQIEMLIDAAFDRVADLASLLERNWSAADLFVEGFEVLYWFIFRLESPGHAAFVKM